MGFMEAASKRKIPTNTSKVTNRCSEMYRKMPSWDSSFQGRRLSLLPLLATLAYGAFKQLGSILQELTMALYSARTISAFLILKLTMDSKVTQHDDPLAFPARKRSSASATNSSRIDERLAALCLLQSVYKIACLLHLSNQTYGIHTADHCDGFVSSSFIQTRAAAQLVVLPLL